MTEKNELKVTAKWNGKNIITSATTTAAKTCPTSSTHRVLKSVNNCSRNNPSNNSFRHRTRQVADWRGNSSSDLIEALFFSTAILGAAAAQFSVLRVCLRWSSRRKERSPHKQKKVCCPPLDTPALPSVQVPAEIGRQSVQLWKCFNLRSDWSMIATATALILVLKCTTAVHTCKVEGRSRKQC